MPSISSSAVYAVLSFAFLSSAQTMTGPYDCLAEGEYTLCQNLWGELYGEGNQSSTLISYSKASTADAISWSTTWIWANNSTIVKSYANVVSNTAKGVQLLNIVSTPTSWRWTYETKSVEINTDVSYDIWLGEEPFGEPGTSASSYEIMIWLSTQGNVHPAGSITKSNITVAGYQWNLWNGYNTNWTVLSFETVNGDITDFNADLQEFLSYLTQNQGVNSTQYVQAIQAGTEVVTGSAVLTTSSYSVAIEENQTPVELVAEVVAEVLEITGTILGNPL